MLSKSEVSILLYFCGFQSSFVLTMSQNFKLIPGPEIPSPNATFVFKTPPRSTPSSAERGEKNITDLNSENFLNQGLLSPELSSPQLDDIRHITSTPLSQFLQSGVNYPASSQRQRITNAERGSPKDHNNQVMPKQIVNNLDAFRSSATNLQTAGSNTRASNYLQQNTTQKIFLNKQKSIPFSTKSFSHPHQTRELRKCDRSTRKCDGKKRSAPQHMEKSSKRSRRVKAPANFKVPRPEELPPVIYEFDDKPPFSYATLIGMALLRSPTRKLTLSQIYHWIYSHFHYYRKGEVGWQNSIRHNLSLNESFEKAEKSKDGKGHYWRVVSGFEYQFCHVQQTRKLSTAEAKSKRCKAKKAPQELQSVLPTIASLHMTNDTGPVSISTTSTHDQISKTPRTISSQARTPRTLAFPADSLGSAYKQSITSPDGSSAQDSPRALPFTSSFNCKSTFEVSPLPNAVYSGPLWEPLTPKKNKPDGKENQQVDECLAPNFKTPLNSMQTPLINIGSSSVIRKLWTSPSYLDDFYTSPIVNNETSDNVSVYKTIYGSPLVIKSERTKVKNQRLQTDVPAIQISGTPKDVTPNVDIKRKEPSIRSPTSTINGYTTNQIFGIDIGVINHDEDRLK